MRRIEQSVFSSSLKPLGGISPACSPGSYAFNKKARFDDSETHLIPKTCILNKSLGNANTARISDLYYLGFHASSTPA